MATITSLLKPAHGSGGGGRQPYMGQMTVDLTAQAISSTAGDVVQCLTIPANTRVLHAGFQVVESATMNTGTISAGIIRVFALVQPVGDLDKATHVSRDMLA